MFWILAFLVVVGVLLPVGAWAARRKPSPDSPPPAPSPSGDGEGVLSSTPQPPSSFTNQNEEGGSELPSVSALALQAIIVHAATFGLAWMAAPAAGVVVSWRSNWEPVAILAAIGVVALAMAVAWLDAKRPTDPNNYVARIFERTRMSDPALIAMQLSAGIAEEFVYRGVLTSLLAPHLGLVFASLVSALLFGFGHVAQGWKGFVGSACFALAFQSVVWLSGGLLLAMAAHMVYDFAAIWLSRRVARAA